MQDEKDRAIQEGYRISPDATFVVAHRISPHIYAIEAHEVDGETDETLSVERYFIEVSPKRIEEPPTRSVAQPEGDL